MIFLIVYFSINFGMYIVARFVAWPLLERENKKEYDLPKTGLEEFLFFFQTFVIGLILLVYVILKKANPKV